MTEQVEIGIYVPQLAFTYDEMLERAQWIEELGFHSMWLFDHLYFEDLAVSTLEGWTLATALLANTTRLRVGHMVLCTNFRHPVLLGKMATTLDHISGGRFLVGLGSGSGEHEHRSSGLPWGPFSERTNRLEDSLHIVNQALRGEPMDLRGHEIEVTNVPPLPPVPAADARPPIVVGGGGARTLDLVARYADWWNCPTYSLDDLDGRLAALQAACDKVGRDISTIRLSTESVLALARTPEEVPTVSSLAQRRFGGPQWGLHATEHIGTPDEVVPRLQRLVDKGITYFVFFLHDRATRESLELLAEEVAPRLRR